MSKISSRLIAVVMNDRDHAGRESACGGKWEAINFLEAA